MDYLEVPASLRNRPGIWFGLLCTALTEHDWDAAAHYRKELDRLGVDVNFKRIPGDDLTPIPAYLGTVDFPPSSEAKSAAKDDVRETLLAMIEQRKREIWDFQAIHDGLPSTMSEEMRFALCRILDRAERDGGY